MTIVTEELVSYAEIISVLENLPLLVREKRRRLGMSYRAAAQDAGCDTSMLHRFEHGENVRSDAFIGFVRWVAS